jgi:hypothetical protein
MSDSVPIPRQAERSAQSKERRAWVRYPPRRLQMFWHLFGAKPPEPRAARIQDISTQGVGIIVDRSFAHNSILVLRFPGTSLDGRSVLARVKQIQQLPNGECKVGCTFVVPLSEVQLAELI